MEFKSEIRDTQIKQLFEKVDGKNYGKYLRKVTLNPIRGFKNEAVSFDFPVTAIIGPNGGGKTSVLGAAACAYISVKPSRFFAKSGKFDSSMQNWSINYDLIDKELNPRDTFSRTAKFTNYKWTREHISRNVAVFGVARTVPANERAELRKCASTNFKVNADKISLIEGNVINAAEKILGKNLTGYSKISVNSDGSITLLTGQTSDGITFSEFHFGAGESSIIKMVLEIETLPDNSLILIEEIENGLHPIATIRMVEFLVDVAIRKKAQAIFTTHSNDALLPLPAKAIWSATNDKFFQGKLDVRSLRAITGQIETQLAIFVEDDFAKLWIETVLASDRNIFHEELEIHKMEGDGNAVLVNKYHNLNPSLQYKSLCFIDGDSSQLESESDNVFRLPGDYPESYIYDKILEKIDSQTDSIIGELTVSLHKPYEMQNEIRKIIKDVRITNRDYHLLFSQLGKKIGFVSEIVVKSAFLNFWIRSFPNEVEKINSVVKASMKR
jgi:AAA15 family ATPase/GTPase